MGREEILLKEYEICQREGSYSSSNYWVTVQIFVGLITALLGGTAFALTRDPSILALILVILLSVMIVLIIRWLQDWLKRTNHFIGINNARMREIEVELGMRRSLIIWGLDHWTEIPEDYRRGIARSWEIDAKKKDRIIKSDNLNDIPIHYRPPRTGREIIQGLFMILGIPWVIVLVIALILLVSKLFFGIYIHC